MAGPRSKRGARPGGGSRGRPPVDGRELSFDVHPDLLLPSQLVQLEAEAARRAGIPAGELGGAQILRRSVDARGGQVRVHLTVRLHARPNWRAPEPPRPVPWAAAPAATAPVVIVGAGPAGLFCAWQLARRGIRSVVVERGKPVRARRVDLAALTRRGELDPESNYCFGEGGAGTFSDGKLYTRSTKRGAIDEVLAAFVAYGAQPDILIDARPHIGTNRLPQVIAAMRAHLEQAGVEFRFGARVDGLWLAEGGGAERAVRGVILRGGERLAGAAVVLAVGHSANDVHEWLARDGVQLVAKPFAMGVRIEHGQPQIDRQQYGALAGHPALGAASYRLVEQAARIGVFSFCMCPGGYIAPAATRLGEQVVNGWSPSQRRGRFANSGFVAEVEPAQVPALAAAFAVAADGPLAGVAVQRALEARAYQAGGGAFVAPAQGLRALLDGRDMGGAALPPCSYPRGIRAAPLHELLGPLAAPLRAALAQLAARMPEFVTADAVAVGVETRTSCAVRVVRDPELRVAPGRPGLYPCGEGAGYAGGIMSAALDGIGVADAIARALAVTRPPAPAVSTGPAASLPAATPASPRRRGGTVAPQ